MFILYGITETQLVPHDFGDWVEISDAISTVANDSAGYIGVMDINEDILWVADGYTIA